MPSKNPAVNKRARDKWYRLNKDKQIKRQIERRKELMEWFWDFKRTLSCSRCGFGFKDHPECCDLHHKDKTKKKGRVSDLALSSKNAMFKELKKCEPLCANCHRTEHKDMYNFSRLRKN